MLWLTAGSKRAGGRANSIRYMGGNMPGPSASKGGRFVEMLWVLQSHLMDDFTGVRIWGLIMNG